MIGASPFWICWASCVKLWPPMTRMLAPLVAYTVAMKLPPHLWVATLWIRMVAAAELNWYDDHLVSRLIHFALTISTSKMVSTDLKDCVLFHACPQMQCSPKVGNQSLPAFVMNYYWALIMCLVMNNHLMISVLSKALNGFHFLTCGLLLICIFISHSLFFLYSFLLPSTSIHLLLHSPFAHSLH